MLGLVKGSIQSKNIGKDITQSFKTIVGGELKAYNEMMNEARALATKRMVIDRNWALMQLSIYVMHPPCHAGSRRGDCVRHSSEIHCLNRKARRNKHAGQNSWGLLNTQINKVLRLPVPGFCQLL